MPDVLAVVKAAPAELAAVLELARAGKLPEALAGLLAIWRTAPHRELADQIVRIGALVAPDRDRTAKQWDQLVATPDPAVLDALLATIRAKGSVKARPRLEALAKWPADPRLDRWIALHYKEPPLTSTGARPYWTRLQPMLQRIADARAIEILKDARAAYRRTDDHAQFMATHVDRAMPKLPAVAEVAPSDADRARLAELATLGVAKPSAEEVRVDDMLAGVLAHPDDDALRVVLADALIEAGDPRGELISLQLDRGDNAEKAKRIAQIIKQSRKHLLGPLDGILRPEVTFSKGFLSRCALKPHASNAIELAIEKAVGHPLWATVEHLEGPGDWGVARDPVMRSLRSLAESDLGIEQLASMPRLEALRDSVHVRKDLDVLLAPASFPALRRLDVVCFADWAIELGCSPFAMRLDELRIRQRIPYNMPFEPALRVLEAAPAVPRFALTAIRNETEGFASTFELVRTGTQLEARVSIGRMTSKYGERDQVAVIQHDVMAGLRAIAKLSPARLVLAPGFTVAAAKRAVESVVIDLGGTVEA